jgi:hypothetical protein
MNPGMSGPKKRRKRLIVHLNAPPPADQQTERDIAITY